MTAMDAAARREAFELEALLHLDTPYRFALRLANGDEARAEEHTMNLRAGGV